MTEHGEAGSLEDNARKWQVALKEAETSARKKEFDMMAVHLKEAIECGAPGALPHLNLAKYYFGQQDRKAALLHARKAYQTEPGVVGVRTFLLHTLLDSGLAGEALEIVEKEIEKQPTDRELMLCQVACYRHLRHWDKAKALADEALRNFPDDHAVIRLMGDVLGEKSSIASLPYYTEAINLSERKKKRPDHPARWNLSLHLLRSRQFSLGWKFYESGLTRDVGQMGRSLNPILTSLKRLDPLEFKPKKGEWLFTCVEQGIGDQILFLSVIEEAVSEFQRLILCAEDRLIPILERSFPRVKLVHPGFLEYLSEYQIPISGFLPIGSLLGRYRQTESSFIDRRRAYIKVSRSKYEKYRQEFMEAAKGRPIVGISWKGGYWESQQGNKSIGLTDWEPVLSKDAYFVSLQYGDVKEELEVMRAKGFSIKLLPNVDFKRDLDDWLAISAACDGIISVSTALVHFAGASGQKVALLMPESQGPWIHGLQDTRSIVYPNVHIFRRRDDEPITDFIERGASVIKV